MFLLTFASIDSLGKVDKHSLSHQTLMELLVGGITANKEKICGDLNENKDIREWNKIQRNPAYEPVGLIWYWFDLEGTVELKWLPLSLRTAYLSGNKLSGTVDLTCLPDGLEILSLHTNLFEGTIDLTRLPPNMTELFLYKNDFCGTTDFGHLPTTLKFLNISNTKLEGEVFVFGGHLSKGNSNVKDMRKR